MGSVVIGSYNPEPDLDNDGDGFTENQGDCNDNDSSIFPGAREICADGNDQDYDGLIDDNCNVIEDFYCVNIKWLYL